MFLKNFFKKRIYLDYASLTPIDKRVIRVVNEYSLSTYANPSSLYMEGVRAKEVIKKARSKIADYLHSEPSELFFTSGGTESNNLAILGTVENFENAQIIFKKKVLKLNYCPLINMVM